ncbi:MAG: hypothetical protein Q8K18_18810 [Burkholderiales bacterium]|nr:hypothetical protein [Burkholderiales bacterium]
MKFLSAFVAAGLVVLLGAGTAAAQPIPGKPVAWWCRSRRARRATSSGGR